MLASDPDNVERACRALGAFGAATETIEALRNSADDEVVWFGVPPVRVDLLKSAPGIDFDIAFTRRIAMHASELMLPVVSLDDLISMKRAADRDQDRADVRRLERRPKKSK